jgi:hypothetical protein
MKRIMMFAAPLVFIFSSMAVASWTSEDLSGYYKFEFWDGNTYAAKMEPGKKMMKVGLRLVEVPDNRVRVYILETPNKDVYYQGKVKGETIYFSDGSRSPVYAEAYKSGENTILIRMRDPNTDELREFTAERTTKEEAERITETNKVGDFNNACMQNMKAIGLAIDQYVKMHEEMPESLQVLYPTYIQDKQVFVCPVHGGEFQDFEQDYELLQDVDFDDETPKKETLLLERKGNHTAPWRFHYELRLDGYVYAVTD